MSGEQHVGSVGARGEKLEKPRFGSPSETFLTQPCAHQMEVSLVRTGLAPAQGSLGGDGTLYATLMGGVVSFSGVKGMAPS